MFGTDCGIMQMNDIGNKRFYLILPDRTISHDELSFDATYDTQWGSVIIKNSEIKEMMNQISPRILNILVKCFEPVFRCDGINIKDLHVLYEIIDKCKDVIEIRLYDSDSVWRCPCICVSRDSRPRFISGRLSDIIKIILVCDHRAWPCEMFGAGG